MNDWMPIGAAIDLLMKQGEGRVENSRGDILEYHLSSKKFTKINKNEISEIATLADEILEYNWRLI